MLSLYVAQLHFCSLSLLLLVMEHLASADRFSYVMAGKLMNAFTTDFQLNEKFQFLFL